MPSRPASSLQPDSQDTVSVRHLRQAVRLLREAGFGGLTKAELSDGLGGVTFRTVDRAVALLEQQGAIVDRGRRSLGKGRSVLFYRLRKGPAWDERPSPLGEAVLVLAQLPASERGGPRWQAALAQARKAMEPVLSHADRLAFARILKPERCA